MTAELNLIRGASQACLIIFESSIQLSPLTPMVADFPKISCCCSIRETSEVWADFAVPETLMKSGSSSRLLLSEVPYQEKVTFQLEALPLKDYLKIKSHYYDEAISTAYAFKIPLKFYASQISCGSTWIKSIRNQSGLWRYAKKPETPPPQPEGYYVTVELVSEDP